MTRRRRRTTARRCRRTRKTKGHEAHQQGVFHSIELKKHQPKPGLRAKSSTTNPPPSPQAPNSRHRHRPRPKTATLSGWRQGPRRNRTHRRPSRSRSRSRSRSSPQTPIMHDRIIRQHGHHTPPDPLMTHPAHSLLTDHDPPIPTPLATAAADLPSWGHAVPQKQQRLAREERRLAQARQNPRLVDGAVGAAHAAPEVGLELGHGEAVRHEGEGRGRGQAGTVLGEQVEGRA